MRISKNRIDMDDKILRKPVLQDYGETVVTADTGSSYTIDLTKGNVFDLTLTANCTFTFSNPPASGTVGSFTLILKQDANGSRTVTWPTSVQWPNSVEPTLSTTLGHTDVIHFFTHAGGSTWYGVVGAQDFATTTVPGAPTSLNAVVASSTSIDLTWSTPSSNGGSAITGYKVYRDTSSSPTTLIDTIGVTTSYTDTSLTTDTTYYYRVKATNANGDSSYSNEDSATPVTGVFFVDSTNGDSSTKSLPSIWSAGDLCIIWDTGLTNGSAPSDVTPSGWTKLHTGSGGASWNSRQSIFARVLQGGDTAPTGLSGGSASRYVSVVFRVGSGTISSFSAAGSFGSSITDGDPAQQSIDMSSANKPLIAVGQIYTAQGGGHTWGGTWTTLSTSSGLHGARYEIFNTADSPGTNTVDVGDTGVNSGTLAGWVELTIT